MEQSEKIFDQELKNLNPENKDQRLATAYS
jgi:hypothetical protein